ncbi:MULTISPECIES: substrate-binding domain-containing protein [Kitasatospora]|uniref:ABC-type phosphate transport system substrate-binding protein n=2 Tax=Kitasatospora TaxID=2063 RepID=A0ABT1IZ54_9ACTN|nr:substrate-binding domain-containing protein [Kitasatospora paracochleata]MCP2310450.1 ABC-type phosphate transport system substrate-binding protein [Kitasatospora paracochleata]
MKQLSKRTVAKCVTVVSGLGLLVAGAGTAQADPSGAPQYRQLAGVGSDTTQGVMNAIANTVTLGGQKIIGSYDAVGTTTVNTKAAAACQGLTRPNGSGAGRTALLNELNKGNGCLDFSRSSSLNLAAATPGLTYVPFAVDGVTYAVSAGSSLPLDLSTADLHAIYSCDPGYVGTAPNYSIHPLLPQAGSGTRSFWESTVGITEADVAAGKYPCVADTKGGKKIEEHDGRVLDTTSLVPFSIAQYIAQSANTIADLRGTAQLGNINGVPSLLLNTGAAATRDVYNVIPTGKVATSPWSDAFVGSNSLVCQQSSVIKQYGFGTNPNCGDTSRTTG